MGTKRALCLSVLAVIGVVAPAKAATLTLNDVTPSVWEHLTYTGPSGPVTEDSPYIGRINWTFDRSASDNAGLDLLVSGTTLNTVCVDIAQVVYFASTTFPDILSDVSKAPETGTGLGMGAGTAALLSKFWDAYYGQSGANNVNAGAFQLGVWEIVGDGSTSLDLTKGNFQASSNGGDATSAAAVAQAQTWLTDLNKVTPTEHYHLYTLSDPTKQDQLFGVATAVVPLPAALPIGLTAMAAMGVVHFVRRRRSFRA